MTNQKNTTTIKHCVWCGGTGVVHYNTRGGQWGARTVEQKCKECKGKGVVKVK